MGRHLKDCTIYAVDFDGTLCESKFPDIGVPNMKLINFLIDRQKSGDKVILWTNRVGEYLENAIEWSATKGLFYDAVNENLPEINELYKDIRKGSPPSPKISADIFIEDMACNTGLPFNKSGCCMKDCWQKTCNRKKSCDNFTDIDTKDLKLTARTRNALDRSCIYTLQELILYTENELRSIRNIGDKAIEEIKFVLKEYNLSFKNE